MHDCRLTNTSPEGEEEEERKLEFPRLAGIGAKRHILRYLTRLHEGTYTFQRFMRKVSLNAKHCAEELIAIGSALHPPEEGERFLEAAANAFRARVVHIFKDAEWTKRKYGHRRYKLRITLCEEDKEFCLVLTKKKRDPELEAAKRDVLDLILRLGSFEALLIKKTATRTQMTEEEAFRFEDLARANRRLRSLEAERKPEKQNPLSARIDSYIREILAGCKPSDFKKTVAPRFNQSLEATIQPQRDLADTEFCLGCYEELPSHSLRSHRCGHAVCGKCDTLAVKSALSEDVPAIIMCPVEGCRHVLTLAEVLLYDERGDLAREFEAGKKRPGEGKPVCGMCRRLEEKKKKREDKREALRDETKLVRLHGTGRGGEEHWLCKEYVRDYVSDATGGKVYCPFFGCGETLGPEARGLTLREGDGSSESDSGSDA